MSTAASAKAQPEAAGKKEHEGRTYYFYTDESLLAFEKDPSEYVATA